MAGALPRAHRHRALQGVRSQVDAERFATTIEHAKLHAEWVDPHRGKIALAEWAAHWLDGKRRIAPKP